MAVLEDELGVKLFLFVPSERAKYHEHNGTSRLRAWATFPQASKETTHAGNCYAVAEYTACVFHCARAVEVGLHAVHACLGIAEPPPGADRNNWGQILKRIKDAIEARGKGALASMKLKHVDLAAGSVFQDAREVQTKFSKSFTTYFLPVGSEVRQIVDAWVTYLRQEKLWGNDDPLFPATLVELGAARQFEAVGLARKHWSTGTPIRAIFRSAFESAGFSYFNPHSIRTTLVQLGQTLCRDAEQFKAWSQNLGHEGVLTTFLSYGAVAPRRQGEIIQTLAVGDDQQRGEAEVVGQAVLQALRGARLRGGQG